MNPPGKVSHPPPPVLKTTAAHQRPTRFRIVNSQPMRIVAPTSKQQEKPFYLAVSELYLADRAARLHAPFPPVHSGS